MNKEVCLIVAKATNNAIGHKNKLLWQLPADLKHFKDITMGFPIIMGRKTYESIGRALPGRQNIVISRNTQFKAPGCVLVTSLEEALSIANKDKVFIIGGGEVYAQALPLAKNMFVTEVGTTPPADTFFEFDHSDWRETSRESHVQDNKNQHNYSFVTYQRADA